MKLTNILILSLLVLCGNAFSNEEINLNSQEDISARPQIDHRLNKNFDEEDLANSPGMGGVDRGGRGHRGGGWGFNPFRWSSGPRRFYNPFSWGNPAAVPITLPTPASGADDDLDAQIAAANQRAKKLEFLLAKKRQLKALEELKQQQDN